MQFLTCIYLVLSLAAAGVLAWFALDMRSILKEAQRKTQLSIDGNWRDLENHFERATRSLRPFVWFHRRYLLPGNLETQYALFLYKRGRLEEALTKTDQAIRQVESKPWIFRSIHSSATLKTLCGALRTRTLILSGLGRYEEARKTDAELHKVTQPQRVANGGMALLEYYCGHFDQALTLAEATSSEEAQHDAMRGVVSLVHCMKGDYDEALRALSFTPANASKFYSSPGLKTLRESPDGAKLIELKHRKFAKFFPPARMIMFAHVYNAQEDFENAGRALDEAEKSLGPEPSLQMAYCRQRACSYAGLGKDAEAERHIERMRAIVEELPKRSFLWESHFATARSYLHLRRFKDALAELTEAQRHVLHPIERHATTYLLALAYGGAGNKPEADSHYRMVVADEIPSCLREKAIAALATPPA